MSAGLSSIRSGTVCLLLLCIIAPLLITSDGQIRRPLVPEDCIRVHYLAESGPTVPIRMGPFGKRVAYVIESADLKKDRALTQSCTRAIFPTPTVSAPACCCQPRVYLDCSGLPMGYV